MTIAFIDPHHDRWHAAVADDGPLPHPAPAPHLLLTLDQWRAVRDTWPHGLPTGVIVPNDVDVEDLEDDLPRLQLVALQFPKLADGRAYSQAHLLRSRYRYEGEIRAVGDVIADMVPLAARTGFDAVVLRADQKRDAAERALRFFAGHYQGDTRITHPLFARKAA